MPVDPSVPPRSDLIDRLLAEVASLRREVEELKRGPVQYQAVYGTRSDAPYSGAPGPRVTFGQGSDGKFGVIVFNADGSVAYDLTVS